MDSAHASARVQPAMPGVGGSQLVLHLHHPASMRSGGAVGCAARRQRELRYARASEQRVGMARQVASERAALYTACRPCGPSASIVEDSASAHDARRTPHPFEATKSELDEARRARSERPACSSGSEGHSPKHQGGALAPLCAAAQRAGHPQTRRGNLCSSRLAWEEGSGGEPKEKRSRSHSPRKHKRGSLSSPEQLTLAAARLCASLSCARRRRGRHGGEDKGGVLNACSVHVRGRCRKRYGRALMPPLAACLRALRAGCC
jgi:hypothetical protein